MAALFMILGLAVAVISLCYIAKTHRAGTTTKDDGPPVIGLVISSVVLIIAAMQHLTL